jgi:hypothetical protein
MQEALPVSAPLVLQAKTDWSPVEHEMLGVIDIEKLLAVERATVEKGKGA